MEKLFQEFNAVDFEQWVEKIYQDLKGLPEDLLAYSPESDLEVRSFYHRSNTPKGSFPNGKVSNQWKNRRKYPQTSNKEVLEDLNEGIDCLGLHFTTQQGFDDLTKGVQFEHIESDIYFTSPLEAAAFKGHSSCRLNMDIFERGITSGKWLYETDDFVTFFNAHPENQTIWVSGAMYGDAGATNSQELAFAANHLNEYIQLLIDNGISLEQISDKIVVELSVTDDYFANIAKFKVFRKMVGMIYSAYDDTYNANAITIYARTTPRYLARNDRNNNLLRQTTQAMSAVIGGCDVITVQPLLTGKVEEDQLYKRMAKNIPLILKEESYLDKVTDPAEGAYYVENLCEQMLNQAWDYFKKVEEHGGLCKAIEKGFIQDLITENRNYILDHIHEGDKTFLGVNKFPSTLEDWQEVEKGPPVEKVTFEPLQTFKVEEYFKKEAYEQS